ncbi:MAG: 30S ribosomal protein S16, partial [Pseudomonadota bacterium]
DGRFIERVGSYNPMVPKDHEERLTLNGEKIAEWMGKGAKPTDRVARLMNQAGLGDAPAIPEQTKQNQPKKKAQERAAEKAQKAADAVAEAEAPAEEAPAE